MGVSTASWSYRSCTNSCSAKALCGRSIPRRSSVASCIARCGSSIEVGLDADELTPVDALSGPSPARVGAALRAGESTLDRAFDAFLPRDLRAASDDFWTPLAAVAEAARWLDELGVQRVVDVGAGPGKFCIAAALASRCTYLGIEYRSRLVAVARQLARQFGVQDRVQFVCGSVNERLPDADAYYLYNPFAENLLGRGAFLADEAELSWQRFSFDVGFMQRRLRRAPKGTLVLTYNGLGGPLPASYEIIRVERAFPCVLRLWRKALELDDGGFSTVELD
jgi:SAM-dependent methyltransferase